MCASTLLSAYFLYFSLLFIYVFFRIFRSRCVGAFHRLIEVISNCKLIALVSVPTERPKTERLKTGRTAGQGYWGRRQMRLTDNLFLLFQVFPQCAFSLASFCGSVDLSICSSRNRNDSYFLLLLLL